MATVAIENRSELQKYLFHLRDLEASSYKQRNYITYLTDQLKRANAPGLKEMDALYKTGVSWSDLINFVWAGYLALGGFVLGFVYEVVDWVIHFFHSTVSTGTWMKRGAIIGLVIGLLIGVGLLVADCFLASRANRKIRKANVRVKQSNQTTLEYARKKAALLKAELDRATRMLKETEAVRARYYAMDVVYPKYRALVPITMFCEYFESGRCSELAGANGAYNIYENESRLDRIEVKLDDIITRLDQIRENQMMLADLLAQCDRELRNLNQTVSRQVDALARLEDKLEVSNYYSRITACNTTCLTWLAVLERR